MGSSSDCTFFCCLSFHYFCIPPSSLCTNWRACGTDSIINEPLQICVSTNILLFHFFKKLWPPFSFTLEFFFNHNNLEVWLLKKKKKALHVRFLGVTVQQSISDISKYPNTKKINKASINTTLILNIYDYDTLIPQFIISIASTCGQHDSKISINTIESWSSASANIYFVVFLAIVKD